MWWRLPWLFSIGIMTLAVLTYFSVHQWPEAFTETVLGIIVGGTAASGGGGSALHFLHNKEK